MNYIELNLDMMIWNQIGSMGSDRIEGAIITKKSLQKFNDTKTNVAKLIGKEVK